MSNQKLAGASNTCPIHEGPFMDGPSTNHQLHQGRPTLVHPHPHPHPHTVAATVSLHFQHQ
eukprot:357416-Chlamydomonas_euryale.AAC.1